VVEVQCGLLCLGFALTIERVCMHPLNENLSEQFELFWSENVQNKIQACFKVILVDVLYVLFSLAYTYHGCVAKGRVI
jgi:hypothetical protein